ncbi:beta-1,3-galactosyl-O-glycosyl-glycoprotein beta-1,6-N-acetylglucosaminyltransferase 7 [Erpetoichthys calabaricus]|uniref:Glucosaminyl (N-acetyl) transferase family member 7 n=1 Tax=Erpetoichthys calabaricus TaxID=27687 RepID=A0A8C4X875_ERPCA|nr:beta-1,3-galactosyl-O-glycosyl-glycoprotein beta-1,6-N-acetylglucosaminyltransferase 7 [Erpetoichthys calabaricus]
MFQLDAAKKSFLGCLGVCIFICTIIYRNGKSLSLQDRSLIDVHEAECGFFPDELCSSFFHYGDLSPKLTLACQKLYWPDNLLPYEGFNCSSVIQDLHFITKPLSRQEETYPLAYIITIHKELDMFVRLLRAIYAPQNVYCIHVDEKSNWRYKGAVKALADCFPNVFLASSIVNVVYAGYSRLQADINCMKDLLRSPVAWKNVINLCGQDFPTMTNKEIIQFLNSATWKGKNITPGVKQPLAFKDRTNTKHKEITAFGNSYILSFFVKKDIPPANLDIYFGSAYYSLTRKFVQFIFKDKRAQELLEWSKDTYSPDEHYWVTLNHLQDAPGSTPNASWEGSTHLVKWKDQEGKAHEGCRGKFVHSICVYAPGDLKWIIEKDNMFANKFEMETFPLAVQCLERRHRLQVLSQAEVAIEPAWRLQDNTYFDMRQNV